MNKLFFIMFCCSAIRSGEFKEQPYFSGPNCPSQVWLIENKCWYNPLPQPHEPLDPERVINQFHRNLLSKKQEEKDAHLAFIMSEDFRSRLLWKLTRFLIAGAVFIGARSTHNGIDSALYHSVQNNDQQLTTILIHH